MKVVTFGELMLRLAPEGYVNGGDKMYKKGEQKMYEYGEKM
ncbi:MAG: hypothetical protein WCU80_12155 [Paludibacteraceae bacterium]